MCVGEETFRQDRNLSWPDSEATKPSERPCARHGAAVFLRKAFSEEASCWKVSRPWRTTVVGLYDCERTTGSNNEFLGRGKIIRTSDCKV